MARIGGIFTAWGRRGEGACSSSPFTGGGDLWVPASMMLLGIILSLGTHRRRRKRQVAVQWRSRTYGEWLPFMFGLVVAIGELLRLLGAPESGGAIAATVERVLALATVFMAVRMVFLLCARGTRRLLRRGEADAAS